MRSRQLRLQLLFVLIVVATVIVCVGTIYLVYNLSKDSGADSEELVQYIQDLEDANAYIQFDTGSESYMHLLYNSKGEAVIELSSGGIGVYNSDNKLYTITEDSVISISDLSPLEFLKAMVKKAGSIECTEEDGDKIYTITITGKENIKSLYDILGDIEYTTRSMEMLEAGFEDAADISIIAEIVRDNDGAFGATLSTLYKSADTAIKEAERYYSWKFDGYLSTLDWELDSAWYETDISDVEKWHTLMSDTIAEVSENMTTYIGSLSEDNKVMSGGNTSEEE